MLGSIRGTAEGRFDVPQRPDRVRRVFRHDQRLAQVGELGDHAVEIVDGVLEDHGNHGTAFCLQLQALNATFACNQVRESPISHGMSEIDGLVAFGRPNSAAASRKTRHVKRIAKTRILLSARRELLDERPNRQRIVDAYRATEDRSVAELIEAAVRSPQHIESLQVRIDDSGTATDEAFVGNAYRMLLQREVDPDGLGYYAAQLADGMTRTDLVATLASSDEYVNRRVTELFPLPDLTKRHSDSYRSEPTEQGGHELCYVAETPAQIDWIAHKIDACGYYDRPGIWGYAENRDKRAMAEILGALSHGPSLDLGCANGAIIGCMRRAGLDAHGVELSKTAVDKAADDIRPFIHHGDVRELPTDRRFKLVSGLDIFEHVPVDALGSLLASIDAILDDDGIVFANVPAFGDDRVYGTVFDTFITPWQVDLAANRPFRLLQVDAHGFPLHGHLIWAGTQWWEEQFTAHGLTRDEDIERAIHVRSDAYFEACAPSRKAFYVFRRSGVPSSQDIIEQIATARFADASSDEV